MPKIFVSYSRNDRAFAEKLADDLRNLGIRVWLDTQDIRAGTKWSTAIQAALQESDLMVLIISPDSMASTNVEDEWQFFLDHNKSVIPIVWRAARVHYQISRLQFINFEQVDYDKGFSQLKLEIDRRETEPNHAISQGDDVKYDATEPAALESTVNPTLRALIIEDIRYYQEFLKDILMEAGLVVDLASTRNEAIAFIRDNSYNLITLDMQLGPDNELKKEELGQDGLFLLSRLKRYQSGVPIFIVSALDWDEIDDERITSREQVKAILRKPLDEKTQDKLSDLLEQHVNLLQR